MSDFRIMPAQHIERETVAHTRWGFWIANHPLGNPCAITGIPKGHYWASWDDSETAHAAAHCLGVDPRDVHDCGFIPAGGYDAAPQEWAK